MMGNDFRRAVHWWDEWQLRILVLGSLGVQWFLLFAAPMRKYTIPRWFRTCIWLAYIGSDALAIYALATLFNRHARGGGNWSSALEVLWAPVLLIHLGGQEEITAYNIEDNELWTRHTVTLVSQVTVAIYAFYRSWSWSSSGDRRLLASAILLFVIGILSFSEKPWAQRRACINRLAAVSSRVHGRGRRTRKASRRFRLALFFAKLEDRYLWWIWWKRSKCQQQAGKTKQDPLLSDADKVHMILSDMSLSAASSDLKKRDQNHMMKQRSLRPKPGPGEVDIEVEDGDTTDQVLGPLSPSAEMGSQRWLRNAFGLIYTRVNVVDTPAYLAYHLLLVPSLHIAAITLFAASDKHAHNTTDVRITYVILVVTAALDVLAEFIRQLLYKLMSAAGIPALCETLPQYNLLGSARRRMRPASGRLLKCAARLGFEEEYFLCRSDDESLSLYGRVAGFVVLDVVRATTTKGLDPASYRSFTVANWALTGELLQQCGSAIKSSLRESFDESVLIWHIATDLCFRRSRQLERQEASAATVDGDGGEREQCTRAISNYMAHLLNYHPDMLMTGSRQHLLTEAVEDIEFIITCDGDGKTLPPARLDLDDATLLEMVLQAGKSERHEYPLIHDACKLHDELMSLGLETRWEVMYHVWVGMLCYSATMCRGYLHAKSLGEGGEFLSFVWLVLSLKGAKTLADKLQMPEPDGQEGGGGPPPPEVTTAAARQSTDDLIALVD